MSSIVFEHKHTGLCTRHTMSCANRAVWGECQLALLCIIFSMQAVGLLLPWWVEHAVPAMLTFMATGRETAWAEHVN